MLPTDDELARRVLGELVAWLELVYLRYPDAAQGLPECWCWHPDVVEELLWLMHAWLAAYQGTAASVGLAADWHDRHRPGVVRRLRGSVGSCSIEAHQTREGWTPGDRPDRRSCRASRPCRSSRGGGGSRRHDDAPEPVPHHAGESTVTGAHRSRTSGRAVLWLPGLAVALGAAVATAHGLYEVALAAAVPAGIAWLYPLITDGLALVAYGATARLSGSAARYAWAVVVVAAGLSGLAQAAFLASGATLDASPVLRFGIGAWPAVAAAVVAHLLYLLATDRPPESDDRSPFSRRPTVQPSNRSHRRLEPRRPSSRARPTPAPTAADAPPPTSAQDRARAAALRHAARHGALPTVSALVAAADVSRGTAATVLKPLRGRPLPLHLVTTTPDDDTIEEHNQP